MKADPFHRGELQAQHLAGQVALGHGIRAHLHLLLEPRASLLFIDFLSGAVLTLQGEAAIAFPQREWRFRSLRGTLAPGMAPLRWRLL